ncbi:hypothetical protein KAR91_58350 [Candidatus Pacearchaeota archaeon]|nr:hypothetical protein [Candidatus Pacearchaeota archaeon]
MTSECLEQSVTEGSSTETANEAKYLKSMMPETRQEGYTCVSGCQDCVSCGGNDYAPRN